jgi:hypothetical protein
LADNFNINQATSGTLTPMAGDLISDVMHPRVKVEFGVDGSASDVSATAPLPTSNYPVTSGGYTTIRLTDIDETEETIKASAGQLYGFEVYNADGTNDAFLHFYDAATPDTAVDTPKMSFLVEAGTSKKVEWQAGIPFATAITVGALTTWAPGATGPDANEISGTFWYK